MNRTFKSLILYSIIITFMSCKTSNVNQMAMITSIEKPLKSRYGTDVIYSEATALIITQTIFEERYENIDFEKFKPFIINLIEDKKVWEIIASKKIGPYTPTYTIRINKNTGEILNLWKSK